MKEYAILVDNGTQWFTYLVELEGLNVSRNFDLPNRVIQTPFCGNIFARPYDIKTLDVTIDSNRSFYGWHISETDFLRIKDLIELDPSVTKFEKLSVLA